MRKKIANHQFDSYCSKLIQKIDSKFNKIPGLCKPKSRLVYDILSKKFPSKNFQIITISTKDSSPFTFKLHTETLYPIKQNENVDFCYHQTVVVMMNNDIQCIDPLFTKTIPLKLFLSGFTIKKDNISCNVSHENIFSKEISKTMIRHPEIDFQKAVSLVLDKDLSPNSFNENRKEIKDNHLYKVIFIQNLKMLIFFYLLYLAYFNLKV